MVLRKVHVVTTMLSLALLDAGWTVTTSPGEEFVFRRDGQELRVFAEVMAVATGKVTQEQWAARCVALGIDQLALGGTREGLTMDPFVTQLASLCREHVTRAKWVFVPSHAIGRTLGERIALGGTNWLNLRFVTPLDIALRMGAPFLVERGIEPSEEGLGPALIMRLLLDLPKDGGYFRPLADQPTMAQALWSTIRELRMAGIKSEPAAGRRVRVAGKARRAARAARLLRAVPRDRTTAATWRWSTRRRCKHPDWCPIQAEDCWTELPDVVWTPLQRRLIDAMPGERIVPTALAASGRDDAAAAECGRTSSSASQPIRSRTSAGVSDCTRSRSRIARPESRRAHRRCSMPAAAKRKSRRCSAASSRPARRSTRSRSPARPTRTSR